MLLVEVIWAWDYFNASGPHYFLTAFYYLRCAKLPMGVIGFIGVSKQSAMLVKIYFNLKKCELAVLPAL